MHKNSSAVMVCLLIGVLACGDNGGDGDSNSTSNNSNNNNNNIDVCTQALPTCGAAAYPCGSACCTFAVSVVDDSRMVTASTSLALDSHGRPRIAYFDEDNDDLRYAAFDGIAWQLEAADAGEQEGIDASLALDANDQPHIGYYRFLSHLRQRPRYAVREGGVWHQETIHDQVGGSHISLRLNAQGLPRVSYYDAGLDQLRYAAFDGAAWASEVADPEENTGRYTSLALDSADQPHVTYTAPEEIIDFTRVEELRYATKSGNTWTYEAVDTEHGRFTSLVLDSTGSPHVTYFVARDTTTYAAQGIVAGEVRYAHRADGVWTAEIVTESATDFGTGLRLDRCGRPHVVFYNGVLGQLHYAVRDAGVWQISVVDGGDDLDAGQRPSLALDTNDRPHVSYRARPMGELDNAGSHLRYAR